MGSARDLLARIHDKSKAVGPLGVATQALNRLLVKGASLDLVHVLLLDSNRTRVRAAEAEFEMRFLTPEEVLRHAEDPANGLTPDFAARLTRGFDLCYAVLEGDRLASYGWYALGSVEPEHAAGAALGLPRDMAYLYKGFTHPDFRGRRLYGAAQNGALDSLEERGVRRLLAFVYWSNAPALRACERLGYRRLGLLVSGSRGPIRVPPQARRCGARFGVEAVADLEVRLSLPSGPPTADLESAE